ncbi:MAG: hypothetical protein IJQ68_01700 [Methanobrevibacter sp.]|uniref:hypothetical protein n=1 Tax=Methanobrevibacter sp. TaxID=66852 RepID=UPI0025CB8249|nr:hypothetical protein [Methanobrevibacter sp.]MBR0270695.1 hypothetical protein [Methanobrevibacter sp.]
MSVNAYLIKDLTIQTTDEEIIIKKILEKTPTFNLSHHNKIFQLFQKHNCDNINDDLTGEISIDKETWELILNKLINKQYSNEELDIITKISSDLKNKDYIIYECF